MDRSSDPEKLLNTCVRIPHPTDRVYTECCISFDTSKSEGGLFVDMNSFFAFGEDYVRWNYKKSGNPIYLHITENRKPIDPVSKDMPFKKRRILTTGVEGRFDQNDSGYEKNYEIVILFPDNVTLPISYDDLPQKVRLAVDKVIQNADADKKDQVAAWKANKFISKHVWDLKQMDNRAIVPPSGLKCEKCDMTDNLWLNLTDGSILCRVSNLDGSDDCAIKHYKMTKYPLAVNLGTITDDLEIADVFSFDEDAIVLDPFLAQHLQHFGLTNELEETENTEFYWNRILEREHEVEPLVGQGYTGLVNLGNSDYLAAIMQVLFSTPSFCSRYYFNQSLEACFHIALADPALDLNMQLTKLAHGLLSGKYSNSETKKQEGIPPRMFKSAISAIRPEFANNYLVEAIHFFTELMDLVEVFNSENPNLDPSMSFKFGVEHRYQCTSSDRVTYDRNIDHFLSLDIPMDKATNQKALGKLKVDELSNKHIRPRVRLIDCLNDFCAPKERNYTYNTVFDARKTIIVRSGLKSFPDYLVLHMKTADAYIDVPDVIDISHMRSKGPQPGEELLPERAAPVQADKNIVSELVSMGFDYLLCQRAAINTLNVGVAAASNWLLNHTNGRDTSNLVIKEQHNSTLLVDPAKIDQLIVMGFDEETSRAALQASGGDVDKAVAWIFDPPLPSVVVPKTDTSPCSNSSTTEVDDTVDKKLLTLPDGPGKYRLIGLVSYVGISKTEGHYVAHVYKDERWVIFNDEQVRVSKDPPTDLAYLYFFERITDST